MSDGNQSALFCLGRLSQSVLHIFFVFKLTGGRPHMHCMNCQNMAGAVDELVLLERVFLRVGSAETDEQLQNVVSKFLPPVLLKLSSQQDGVRKKVMELLVHINKRIKTRPLVRLPVDALLVQYQDPSASSFVINFTIIYIKMGFPRLTVDEQTELVPIILNALDSKPQSHQDSLLLLIIPLLGKLKIPTDPLKRTSLFGLNEKPHISKYLLGLLLDMLLLPYGALSPQQTDNQTSGSDVSMPVPPGMSEYTFKRVTNENPLKPEELEQIKLGIVKFLSNEIFPNDDILIHLIVAAADTRFSVANLADMELKKVVGSVDWASPNTPMPLFLMFLGTQTQNVKANLKKSPASTRIRLKLLTYLCRVTGNGFVIPPSIQIIFDSLYGTNTNSRLKSLALNFTGNLVRDANAKHLIKVASVLQSGLNKLIKEGEPAHKGQAFIINGMIGRRFPMIVYHDVSLLELFFKKLESADPDLKLQIREGLLNLITAYKYDVNPQECDKNGRINILFALMKFYMNSEEPMVRFAAVKTIATIFPPDHVPSKVLLLLAMGDVKDDVFTEATKSLYGTSRKNDIDMSISNKSGVTMPTFSEIAMYVYNEAEIRLKDPSKRITIGNHVLAFTVPVYTEILLYMRLCLNQSLNVPLTRSAVKHPCKTTPIIREYLQNLYKEGDVIDKSPLLQYLHLIKQLMVAHPAIESICCMLEIVGCVPQLYSVLEKDMNWLRDLMNSLKEEIREQASVLYAFVLNYGSSEKGFDEAIGYLIKQANSKNLESQHGAILGIGNCIERMIVSKSRKDYNKWETFKSAVNTIVSFLSQQNVMLIGAACTSLGLIGKSTALPLDNGIPSNNGSPDAKRPAIGRITKFDVLTQLLEIMKNAKLPSKVRERAARSLGLLCVGEDFPFTKEVIQGLLDIANETKDVEVHFSIGESLVMCVQGVWSAEARDSWTVLPSDYYPENTMLEKPKDDNLEQLVDDLLRYASGTHPNARQASSIWLLALLKSCPERDPIKNKLQIIQNTFMDLLGENNDIVQDVASKGLCLVYDYSKSEDLLVSLVDQLTTGRRTAVQVTSNTKLFEERELGQAPTGGNLTTYKELCSLASDLNKPDLIYQFMQIANHNSIWNSKKGAAFGFSTIAQKSGEHLQPFLPKIIPKLYRYQYDPTPSLQMPMQNIWHALVSEPQKMLDLYHKEILEDLLLNLTSPQYRVRHSCCLALQDFMKGSGNRSIHDSVNSMAEVWTQLFRVMDDHHEATRLAANKTAKILSKLCIKACDVNQGKDGVKMMQVILPVFLDKGITNTVSEVRMISLQTISELVRSAGQQLKPFLPQLIPALLLATGELEPSTLAYWSTRLGAQAQSQEVIDTARASLAKSHFTTETVSKCLQYADETILEDLVPKVTELMKGSVGLGTRVACAHFITLLVVQLGQSLQQYTGKFLASLVNGLTDRNAVLRKHYASAIGHLVGSAKESSLEKLFAKINHWYFEREDDSIRSACAHTIKYIGVHNQDILKNHSDVVMPLVFFAMHAEKTPETENTLEIWNEIWTEHSPGTESGIRQNLDIICDTLKTALESPSWTMKAQAASAISTVATKLGSTMDNKHQNSLIKILLTGLVGRTWNGKHKLIQALASICKNCKDSLKNGQELDINEIVDAVLKECKKEEINYKIHALESLGNILSSLEVDRFEDVYNIVRNVINKDISEISKEDDANSTEELHKSRENNIKLKEVVFETLGKAWPENSKETQEKYREMLVENCVECLPKNTRSVQVCIVTALCNYVDKVSLLSEIKLDEIEEECLVKIIDNILKALIYSLSIAKNTRLRKESLNVVFSLAKKLNDSEHRKEFEKLCSMFEQMLPDLTKDNQPEIKSRVTDIKKLLKNE